MRAQASEGWRVTRNVRSRPRPRPRPRNSNADLYYLRTSLRCVCTHRGGAVRGHQTDGEHLRRHARCNDLGGRELGAREGEGGDSDEVQHGGDRFEIVEVTLFWTDFHLFPPATALSKLLSQFDESYQQRA